MRSNLSYEKNYVILVACLTKFYFLATQSKLWKQLWNILNFYCFNSLFSKTSFFLQAELLNENIEIL